jgi:hypothetical protein
MFGSTILEVVIGIFFIYVLLSLLATTINELILSLLLSARGKDLEKAIVTMLSDRKPVKESPIETNNSQPNSLSETQSKSMIAIPLKLLSLLRLASQKRDITEKDLAEKFYGHPYIIKLAKQGKNDRPAYISRATFSKVVIDLLEFNREFPSTIEAIEKSIKTIPGEDTQALLLSFIRDAGGDIAQFRLRLENWYDEMMDRASGWYKRRAQKALLLIGFSISALLNVDTINIAHTLYSDPEARSKIVTQSIEFRNRQINQNTKLVKHRNSLISNRDTTNPIDSNQLKKIENHLQSVNQAIDSVNKQINYLRKEEVAEATSIAGMGWDHPGTPLDRSNVGAFFSSLFKNWLYILYRLPGWLITTLAITLGAPFWFDMLNKVINIRNAGLKPEEKKGVNTSQQVYKEEPVG